MTKIIYNGQTHDIDMPKDRVDAFLNKQREREVIRDSHLNRPKLHCELYKLASKNNQ